MWAFARSAGFDARLKALQTPRPATSILAALFDWLIIAVAVYFCFWLGWWLVPLVIVVVGNRQRALGNLLHDASHYSLHRNHRFATWLSNVLLCWPLWINMSLYRREHTEHHNHLADPRRDPDYIHGDCREGASSWQIVLQQVLSPQMFRNALLGHLGRVDAWRMSASLVWWLLLVWVIAGVFTPEAAAAFVLIWIAARATSFHVITAIREISDHVGLSPGTLIGFSRNHVFGGLAAQLIHPHNNGYHLLHHLAPRMPFHALPRAHALLMAWPRYAQGVHCDSYLFGSNPAARSWCGGGAN